MEKTLELICETLSNKKGVLIKVLDVKDLTSIADYFIISSVMNKKQAQASADEVEEKLEEAGIKEGDEIDVKLIDIDPKTGKFKLSRKVLLPRPEKK